MLLKALINDLLEGLISDVKLFADDTAFFMIANCAKASAWVLNSDSIKIRLGMSMEDDI